MLAYNYSTKLKTEYSSDTINLTKCKSLTIQDLVTIDDSGYNPVFYNMCIYNTRLESVDIGNIKCNSVKSTYNMFNGCSNLTNVNIDRLIFTEADSTMSYMFKGCKSLEKLDLTNVNTTKVTSMIQMFYGCTNLKEILVSRGKWVIANGCNTTDMFKDCGVDHVTYVD